MTTIPLYLRLALRELRSGTQGFRIFLLCLILGVMAIAAVGSFSASLKGGLAQEGRSILGGDIELTLVHVEMSQEQRAFVDKLGTVSRVATLRAMARPLASDARGLVEIKAIEESYPLFGALELAGPDDVHKAIGATGDSWGAVVEETLLAKLGVDVGDQLKVGEALITITDTIAREPDRIASGMAIGPRLMLSHEALAATKLVQPGSLVRFRYRVRLDDAFAADVNDTLERLKNRFPAAGWQIRDRSNGAPGMRRFVDRLTLFLTLVGLTALLVGGVGVGNGVKSYLDTKRDVIATYKSLGATGNLIFKIYLAQVLVLAAIAIVGGLVAGALLPVVIGYAVETVLPLPIRPGLYAQPLVLAGAFGVLTTLVFAVWPLARARDIPASALFRDVVAPSRQWPRFKYVLAIMTALAILATLAIAMADDRRITMFYVAGSAASFVLLWLIAQGLMFLAARAPRPRQPEFRLGLANLHRPGAPTPSVVLSLGLGLTLLVTLSLIDANMSRELNARMPAVSPSFFFVDIQPDQLDSFEGLVRKTSPEATIERVPMLRGRIVRLKDKPVGEVEPSPDARWVIRGSRAVTYSESLPKNSTLERGEWWAADYDGPPLVSFVDDLARGLGLDIEDEITINVLGREITARIANTRSVEWGTLRINTVMVFSPNALKGAPHTHLATVTMDAAAELDLLRKVSDAYPNITAVRIKEVLDTVNGLLSKLLLAIRGASGIALMAGVLVLAGAMAAGHRSRIYDAVVLKTVGATRKRLMASYIFEFAVLGLATAVFAVMAGTAASYLIVRFAMDVGWVFLPAIAGWTVVGATLVTVTLGLAGTWRILGQKAAPVLRTRA